MRAVARGSARRIQKDRCGAKESGADSGEEEGGEDGGVPERIERERVQAAVVARQRITFAVREGNARWAKHAWGGVGAVVASGQRKGCEDESDCARRARMHGMRGSAMHRDACVRGGVYGDHAAG